MGAKKITNFKQLSRQNTGSHPLDSGDAYGRHWQRPLPKGLLSISCDTMEIRGKLEQYLSASINVGEFLDSVVEIDRDLRKTFKAFANRGDQKDNSWWDVVHKFAEYLDMDVVAVDYSYNWETDLSQDFQFFVLQAPNSKKEWLYDEDAILFIQTHNGCDARGGFSEPIPVKGTGYDGFCKLFDANVGWSISEGVDANGKTLSEGDCRALDKSWEIGYASNPTSKMLESVELVLMVDADKNIATLKLKTGETVVVYPTCVAGN